MMLVSFVGKNFAVVLLFCLFGKNVGLSCFVQNFVVVVEKAV